MEYAVKETITVIHYIEADNESAAIAKAKERSPLAADEIDTSVYHGKPTATLTN